MSYFSTFYQSYSHMSQHVCVFVRSRECMPEWTRVLFLDVGSAKSGEWFSPETGLFRGSVLQEL